MMWILYLAILFGVIAIILRLTARHLRNKAMRHTNTDSSAPFIESDDDDLGAW